MGPMLPTFDPMGIGMADVVDSCRRAEALGFDSVWTGDHLAFNSPILDATHVLAAAAAVTERVRIGTSVLLLAMRNPAWVAKQIATLQHLAGGRLVLGVGVGGENRAEWAAAGVDPSERGARTDEMLSALPDLLAGRPCHVLGLNVPALLPVADPPEIWVGGRSDAALRRTVRHASRWVGAFVDARKVAEIGERIAAIAGEERSTVPGLAATVFVHVTDRRALGEAESAQYLMSQYGIPWDRIQRYCVVGNVASVAEALADIVDAGAEELVLMSTSSRVDEQFELLAGVRSVMVGSST